MWSETGSFVGKRPGPSREATISACPGVGGANGLFRARNVTQMLLFCPLGAADSNTTR